MDIQVRCPKCACNYVVDDAHRGKVLRCRDCKSPIPVPAADRPDEATSVRRASDSAPPAKRRIAQPAGDDKPGAAKGERPTAPARRGTATLPLLLGGGAMAAMAGLVVIAVVVVGLWLVLRRPAAVIPLAQDEPPVKLVAPAMEGTIPLDVLAHIKDATVFVKMDAGRQSGSGSGFLMRVEGDTAYFATNDHVVTPPAKTVVSIGRIRRTVKTPKARISVVLRSGTPREQVFPAEVVTADPDADLAVLRVTGARDLPRPIDFSQQVDLVETMPLFIFGFPFGKSLATNKGNPAITVGKGAISSFRRDERGELNLVQINGDLNPGNSGGPVVDVQGRLIGVSVAAIKGTQIGMAIPAPELTQLLKGRALGTIVFKKSVVGGSADIHGELWILDRFRKIKTSRTVSMRLNNVALGGDAGDFEVEAMLLDPLRKIQTVALLYVRTDTAPQARPNAQGRWDPLPGATQLPLRIDKQKAVGGLDLPAGTQPNDLFSFQLAIVNGAGQAVYTQPRSFRLNFQPGAVAIGPRPPIGPGPGVRPPIAGGVKDGATIIMGGAFDPVFKDEAPDSGLLIGFDVGLGKFVNNEIIVAVRPIFRTAKGESPGKPHGTNFARTVSVKAKPGYAVGAITAKSGLGVDGFHVTFMRVTGNTLDVADSYSSDWIGGKGGGRETVLGGGGTPISGMIGKSNNRDCTGIGLLLRKNAG